MLLFVKNPAKISNVEVDADLNLLSTFRLLNLPNPTLDQHSATKKYVDDADALLYPKSGGTMTGHLNMGGYIIMGALITSTLSASDTVVKDYTLAETSVTGVTPTVKTAWTLDIPYWVAPGSVIRTAVEIRAGTMGKAAYVKYQVNGVDSGSPDASSNDTYGWVTQDITVGPGDVLTFLLYNAEAGYVSYMRNQQVKFNSVVWAPTASSWRA